MQRNKTRLLLDLVLLLAFLLATAPELTGITIHEWLSLGLAAAILTHLLLNWSWILQVMRRFFGKVSWKARINYILNSLLFIVFTIIITTGILISEAVLPLFGLSIPRDRLWLSIHHTMSDVAVLLIGLHVALHWRWIVNTAQRIFGQRRALTGAKTLQPTSKEVSS
ncbi:DUF4405 domain-containing protein [Candidatus Viridilinea mediisalina]|uniref:Flavinylation-associated cytochrome domain-containing protein n=1 Tax=Candidatus Viridilinea mediisalina TaxID=2024553 RepID=A0A2A6REL3_9CHLR|nr:DUF4405 domain-containing protein [Candidatus Viridilinea mediisalina]PDW01564.1 hypothetical protein CJ255_18475 [Candidatus Viridilinea mediisalina]